MISIWMRRLVGGKQKATPPENPGELIPLLEVKTVPNTPSTPTIDAYKKLLTQSPSVDTTPDLSTETPITIVNSRSKKFTPSTSWRNYFITMPFFSRFCGCGRYLPDDLEEVDKPIVRSTATV